MTTLGDAGIGISPDDAEHRLESFIGAAFSVEYRECRKRASRAPERSVLTPADPHPR